MPAAPTHERPPVDHRPSPSRDVADSVARVFFALALLIAVMAVAGLVVLAFLRDNNDSASQEAFAERIDAPAATISAPDATDQTAGSAPDAATESPATTEAAAAETTVPASPSTIDEAPTTSECSATGVPAPAIPGDIAEPAVAILAAIIDAVEACDIGALASLAPTGFTASFGGGEPGAIWQEQEANGAAPLRRLLDTLSLPHAAIDIEGETVYVWPSAVAFGSWSDVPEPDRLALASVYRDEELAAFEQFGAFFGHRIAIGADGEWRHFVAGD